MNLTPDKALARTVEVIGVGELNLRVRKCLERSVAPLWVAGEISNFARAPSGHWYFSLKDRDAQVRCVMFRHRNQFIESPPVDGMAVEVYALVTLYEPKGDYQLVVEQVRRAGVGKLYEMFEQLKRKLEAEGLFDAARKRALPAFARRVGVITSPAGAVLHDVITILRARSPHVQLIVYPAQVQGANAADSLIRALQRAQQRNECDALILCRGGGSIEDLWAFNDERLARALAACTLPLVSAVGHETDFSIADFVADARAPTPTAAAQMIAPERASLLTRLSANETALRRSWQRRHERYLQRLDELSRALTHPRARLALQALRLRALHARLQACAGRALATQRLTLADLAGRLAARRPDLGREQERMRMRAQRLRAALALRLEHNERSLLHIAQSLEHLHPHRVLARGYSIVRDRAGAVVTSSARLRAGETLRLTFREGEADAEVTKTDP